MNSTSPALTVATISLAIRQINCLTMTKINVIVLIVYQAGYKFIKFSF